MRQVSSTVTLLLLAVLACHSNAFVVPVAEEQEIEVIPNPHAHKGGACSGEPLEQLLEPNQLILSPMVTQADTFQELTYAKVLTVPVPVYAMKQPARLSEAQLPFQLVLVKELSARASNIHQVSVPIEQARDSWFPGYYWSPLVMQCGADSWQHVGWKFTSLNQASTDYNSFYALIVQVDKKQQEQGIRIGELQSLACGVLFL